MMENHGYSQIINNPNAPFINQLREVARTSATNYFAVAHPSLTNYLEVVGGSNFGVLTATTTPTGTTRPARPNLASGTPSTRQPAEPEHLPDRRDRDRRGDAGFDIRPTRRQGTPGDINIDGMQSIPRRHEHVGKTIADQLVAAGTSLEELPGEPAARAARTASTSATASHEQHGLQRRSLPTLTRR